MLFKKRMDIIGKNAVWETVGEIKSPILYSREKIEDSAGTVI